MSSLDVRMDGNRERMREVVRILLSAKVRIQFDAPRNRGRDYDWPGSTERKSSNVQPCDNLHRILGCNNFNPTRDSETPPFEEVASSRTPA